MHSVRNIKAYYFAAFLLGAVIALLVAAPARAADVSLAPCEPSGLASKPMPEAFN